MEDSASALPSDRAEPSATRVIAIGASAGGIPALTELVAGLPADLDAAVLVVVHVPADGISVLPQILARSGRLPAEHVRDPVALRDGRILVAPPDRHLVVRTGRVEAVSGPHVHGHRPAIDRLFESAAEVLGPRVTGVVMSGLLDDGVRGLQAIADAGGTTIVQDPATALFDAMPRNALARVDVDHVLAPRDIAQLLSAPARRTGLIEHPVVPPFEATTQARPPDASVGDQRVRP